MRISLFDAHSGNLYGQILGQENAHMAFIRDGDQSRFLMYSSVPRSLYLDQYLAVIDCSSNHCGPRSV